MNAADRDAQRQRMEDKLDAMLNLLTTGEIPQVTTVISGPPIEELLAPTPTGRRKRVTEITPQFRSQMVRDFAEKLGGEDEVHRHIDTGMAHKSHEKYNGKQQHIRNWLHTQVEIRKRTRGSPDTLEAKRVADRTKHLMDFEDASLQRRPIGRTPE